MLNQYRAGRSQWTIPPVLTITTKRVRVKRTYREEWVTEYRPLPQAKLVGTVKPGTIFYRYGGYVTLGGPHVRHGHAPQRQYREPWIVEAWTNREYYPCVPGHPHHVMMQGGHLAVVRSLRTNQRIMLADWIILNAIGDN